MVICSSENDHGFELLVYVLDDVDEAVVRWCVRASEIVGLGVSRRDGFGWARRSPRASARAWRSRWLSVSSSRMRCAESSSRRSSSAWADIIALANAAI